VVPIINENDAVSANKGYTPSTVFSDNDSLACLVAKETNAEVRPTPLLPMHTSWTTIFDLPMF
jgi:glutamate 5-kinase